MSTKILFTGKTHTTAGQNGAGRSADGFLDIKLPQPHPAAEDLFGVAWSACYMGAIEVAASRRKIMLPPGLAVDAKIDLHLDGVDFFLTARLNVSMPGVDTSTSLVDADVSLGTVSGGGYGLAVVLKVVIPGVDHDTVRSLTEAAHQVCPYSKATRGNITVETNLIDQKAGAQGAA